MLTIVIPAHNREHLIERTLQSVAAQTYRPMRVVLVDNGSTDGTLAVMRQWAEEQQAEGFSVEVIEEPRPGACAARNAGLARVTTQWTMFFDSDDTMAPNHVERALSTAAAHPRANVIGWNIRLHIADKKPCIKPFAIKHVYANCILHGTMATQRYMAHTELFRRAGGWREDVAVWNDIELGIRLLPHARMAKAHGEPTVDMYDSGAASITGINYSSKGAEREHSLDCIEANLPVALRPIVSLRRAILAGLYRHEGAADASQRLLKRALKGSSLKNRLILLLAYRLTALGLPAASHLLALL
ncbi:MAG: glycosyltransferase family 2 protein [Bacteroidales bacterium]|nr:glycosyltransferase family 2 protein [Bacteroidales bacterium]